MPVLSVAVADAGTAPLALVLTYPLVNIQRAIENGHRNSGFIHGNGDVPQLCKRLPEGTKQTMNQKRFDQASIV